MLPGYRYLGPFNPIDNGEPVNKADRAAKKHDLAYDQYLKSGKNPYLYYNKADSDFVKELEGDYSAGGIVGRLAFGIKRAIAPKLQEAEPPSKKTAGGAGGPPSNKRPRNEAAHKRHLYFARGNRDSKRARMEAGEGTSDQNNQEAPAPGGGPSVGARAGAGGGGGGVGGVGGSGVGISTGGWTAGTHFGDNYVVTNVTRQWYAPVYNNHIYKALAPPNGNSSKWKGIETPWGYFNFNCYNCHFSPQDWQRLLNEYKKWRPKKMRVQLYNLQIKQIVTLGADTLYNNDLTAGVHIFCDGSHQLPYSQHGWDDSCLPELPNDVYRLPQYAYFQYQEGLKEIVDTPGFNIVDWLKQDAPLFMLEHSSHEVLRTGEETHFEFDFESGWVHNDRAYCPPQADFNPLINTKRFYPTYDPNTKKYLYNRYNPYKKPSNWLPGPYMHAHGNVQENGPTNDGRSVGPITTVIQPPNTKTANGVSDNLGFYDPARNEIDQYGWMTAPVYGASSTDEAPKLAYDAGLPDTDDTVSLQNIDMDMTRVQAAYVTDSTVNGNVVQTNTTQKKEWYQLPMQTWNDPPISRNAPIWDKIPNTDHHTTLSSSDGTLPIRHPPGTIFVKVAKIPIPSAAGNTYLNLYVTGQVSCEILWEAERYQTKNWRPEIRITSSQFKDTDEYNFDTTGKYIKSEHIGENMPTRMGMNRNN